MTISLQNTGKRFNREWIFRNFSYQFNLGNAYAITGANGAGKSTLLQVLAGATLHNEGNISASVNGTVIAAEKLFNYIAISAPYLELIEEMTALEFLDFHANFKSLTQTPANMLAAVDLSNAANKQIRYYSSGMKQRLKLAQAFFTNAPVLLLDEPTTNLDAAGIAIYLQLVQQLTKNRLVIVSSNNIEEYRFCNKTIALADYKK